uniref:Uncharacterized protein n=1 Tax=Picea sitchensis TaxID=3332 RepID=A0A6B9XXM2_PICSI|nr:hypothetical protein Q903MT_gene6821 [Picea sitchensis]
MPWTLEKDPRRILPGILNIELLLPPLLLLMPPPLMPSGYTAAGTRYRTRRR